MKIDIATRMTIPKIAVLATGLAAVFLVAASNPQPAQASAGKATECTRCHQAGGSVTAAPSDATPASGVPYTVAIALTTTSTGKSGYWISDGADVSVVGDPVDGSSLSAAMTAPAAAGTYTYTVWADRGGKSDGQASSARYSITVAKAPATIQPPASTAPSSKGPLVGLGVLALVLVGAGTTWGIRRRGQN